MMASQQTPKDIEKAVREEQLAEAQSRVESAQATLSALVRSYRATQSETKKNQLYPMLEEAAKDLWSAEFELDADVEHRHWRNVLYRALTDGD